MINKIAENNCRMMQCTEDIMLMPMLTHPTIPIPDA
jgi:hypothetical protein